MPRVPKCKRFFTRYFKSQDKAWEYYSMLYSRGLVASYCQDYPMFDDGMMSYLCYSSECRMVCELIYPITPKN